MPIIYGAVGAPSSTSAADNSNLPLLQGKAGEGIVAELHGKWYTGAYRNMAFLSGGAAAGTTIPVSSTTAPTFTLYNPIGSGKVVELIKLNVSILNATTVVSSIALGMISGLLVAPTSVTAIPIVAANGLAVATPAAQLWSAATLAAAATRFFTLFSVSATSGAFGNNTYDFDGSVLLQPGSLVHVCGTAAQTSASLQSIAWAEWAA